MTTTPTPHASRAAREVALPPGTTLLPALLEELAALEGTAPDVRAPRAIEFWLRRRRVTRLATARDAAERLAPPWRFAVRLPSDEVTRRLLDLGVSLLALASRAVADADLGAWLEPFGSTLARRVVSARNVDPRPDPDVVFCSLVKASRDRALDERRGPRAAAFLARRLVAALWRRLPEEAQPAARAVAVSNLCEKLDRDLPMPLVRESDATRAFDLFAAAFSPQARSDT
jgi:hypothetical protein